MDTNGSLSQGLIVILISEEGNLDSSTAEWACCALGPKLTPSLCSQTSVLTVLAHKPSSLGIREPQCTTLTVQQRKKLPYGAGEKTQRRINLHSTRLHPNYIGCPGHLCFV